MITLISLLLLVLIVKITFKVLPALIGFSFTLFLTLLQIVGFFLLVPIVGILFILIDLIVIGSIVGLIKIFV